MRSVESTLGKLSVHEKRILEFHIVRRSQTEYWNPFDTGVQCLVAIGILSRNTYVAEVVDGLGFDIRHEWFQYLIQHKEDLVSR